MRKSSARDRICPQILYFFLRSSRARAQQTFASPPLTPRASRSRSLRLLFFACVKWQRGYQQFREMTFLEISPDFWPQLRWPIDMLLLTPLPLDFTITVTICSYWGWCVGSWCSFLDDGLLGRALYFIAGRQTRSNSDIFFRLS